MNGEIREGHSRRRRAGAKECTELCLLEDRALSVGMQSATPAERSDWRMGCDLAEKYLKK